MTQPRLGAETALPLFREGGRASSFSSYPSVNPSIRWL